MERGPRRVLLTTLLEYPFFALTNRADFLNLMAAVLDKSGRTDLTASATFFPDLRVCKVNFSVVMALQGLLAFLES